MISKRIKGITGITGYRIEYSRAVIAERAVGFEALSSFSCDELAGCTLDWTSLERRLSS